MIRSATALCVRIARGPGSGAASISDARMAAEMSPPASPGIIPSVRFTPPRCVSSDTRPSSDCPKTCMTSPAATAVSRNAAGSSHASSQLTRGPTQRATGW